VSKIVGEIRQTSRAIVLQTFDLHRH
jgi:hypothetical protein